MPPTENPWRVPDVLLPVLQTLGRCVQVLTEETRDPAVDEDIDREQASLEDEITLDQTDILRVYNHWAVTLGTHFTSADIDFVKRLQGVESALPQFLTQDEAEMDELRNLQREFSESVRLDFTRQLSKQAKAIKTALGELAHRKGRLISLPISEPSPYSHIAIRDYVRSLYQQVSNKAEFCQAAIYLQKNKGAELSSIASNFLDGAHAGGGGGYWCNRCGLSFVCMEMDANGLVQVEANDWKTLASCHMQAHFSFTNMAAWYMCTVCHDRGIPGAAIVFITPITMMQHLAEHETEKIR